MKPDFTLAAVRFPARFVALPYDPHHDPYHHQEGCAGPSVCTGCHAVFVGGHWDWGPAPSGAAPTTCPACLRIREQRPGAYITLKAGLSAHEELLVRQLLHNIAQSESMHHAMARIIGIVGGRDRLLVTTTSPGLAEALAVGLQRAFGGRTHLGFNVDERLLRVQWERD